MSKPRVWLSTTSPKANEIVRVRALIEHRMETGLRPDEDGNPIERNIINLFEARINDELLFSWHPETAISQNPYLEFTFIARESGTLSMKWVDDTEHVITDSTDITVS